jgi:site-specific DNA-cytosine methylase
MTTKGFQTSKGGLVHWEGRDFTNAEYAALQGFPSSYQFTGTDQEVRRQIGNALPPAFWMEVLKPIAQWLTDWKEGKLN